MGSVTSWSRARAGLESSTFYQRRLIQTLDSLGVGSEVLVEPAGPVSAAGSWLLRPGRLRLLGEFVAEQDSEGLGEVAERHFEDTAADSAHRMADPGGHARSTLGYGRSCASRSPAWNALDGRPVCQFAVAAAASGLMWANMLRPFQLGKARTSHDGPWSWIRESRVASAQDSWPACHFTNASASAVM
jgi:hypothetical protein